MDQLRPLKQRASMPSFSQPRRHNTVPTSFHSEAPQTAQDSAANGSVETLYSHPSVRIIAFSAGKSAFDRPGPGLEEKPGTLPSSSQFERSIAFGAFQIYRAPGSVAFLRSGTALQPILPKSQAWCLDEQSSKFVLQIRRPNYWRIEIPVGNDEEIRTAHMLREVLDRILQFEKTPCPFERAFTVELPITPKTPIKKRMWTPPARTVSMNWPPGAPVTPPPEFASRTRFYNPGARRFSDFGADTSKLGLTPAASPKVEQVDEVEEAVTPSRRERDVSLNMCGPLLEEPESLSPPPTAIPWSITQVTEKPSTLASSMLEMPQKPAEPISAPSTLELSPAEAPVRKREPIWVTKKKWKTPEAARKTSAQRPVVSRTQSATAIESVPRRAEEPVVQSVQTSPERSPSPELDGLCLSPQSIKETARDASGELEAIGGALEGSGQLRVRRTRLAAFASRRAATAPTLRLRTPSISRLSSAKGPTPEPEETVEASSPAESTAESLDSFHSLESWHEPLSPPAPSPAPSPLFSPSKTYPYPHQNIPLAINKGQTSGFTTTPTVSGWERNSSGPVMGSGCHTPDTPFTEIHEDDRSPGFPKPSTENSDKPLTAIAAAPLEEPPATTETDSLSTSYSSAASHTSNPPPRRATSRASTTSVEISHRSPRGLSPLPPAATLLNTSPSSPQRNVARAIRRIPSSIFNKTCEILISPPAHLISLMLRVAERISAGEWRGFVFGLGEGGELLDVRWDYADEWEESAVEDYGFAISAEQTLRSRKKPAEYRDPWAGEPDEDDDEQWSRSWGVD